MYDSVVEWKNFTWLQYQQIKFICFSKTLYTKLKKLGFTCIYIKYYPIPPNTPKPSSTHKTNCFFWQRTNHLTWHTIKELLPEHIDSFHLHLACDPGHKEIMPSADDLKKYNITISRWFKNQNDYLKLLKNTTIYFAPRLYEGIGLSFLEPMSEGKCIVAPDKPTMNEYITNNKTGILYPPETPRKISFKEIDTIRQNAFKDCRKGYENWKNYHEEIQNFLEEEQINNTHVPYTIKLLMIKTINTTLYKITDSLKRLKKSLLQIFTTKNQKPVN